MNSEAFEKLLSEDWRERMSAVREIERYMAEESNVEALLSVRGSFDLVYTEDKDAWGRIKNPEILYLRASFADRCRQLNLQDPRVQQILSDYVSDRLPDTYPIPFFDQQGPEWTAPSKWKVRISAAYALGVIGNENCLNVLRSAYEVETVRPALRAIALAISVVDQGLKGSLTRYLSAYERSNRTEASNAVRELISVSDKAIRKELNDLLSEIESG
jgi:hypothetical protein